MMKQNNPLRRLLAALLAAFVISRREARRDRAS